MPASISMAMSASWKLTPWKLPIGRPNCFRTPAYAERLLVGPLGDPERKGGDPDAAGVQRLEEVDEALPRRPQQVLLGHHGVLEDQLAGVARPPAHLVFLLAGADPRVLGRSSAWPTPMARHRSRSTVSLVTMKLVMPLLPRPGSVRAVTEKISPTPAWVMKFLEPLRT